MEGRVASDEDLKLSDLLRYYLRDTDAAKALLYRRAKCLSEFDNANKALDKARAKNKDIGSVSNRNYDCFFFHSNEIRTLHYTVKQMHYNNIMRAYWACLCTLTHPGTPQQDSVKRFTSQVGSGTAG